MSALNGAVVLSACEYGPATSGRLPLLLVHGLFGASGNWLGIARRLRDDRSILVPDLRNHGDSPWDPRMDYPSMAGDLERLLDDRGIERAHLVGHSMGGKAAMWLALSRPERVASIVVADVAPVTYGPRFGGLVSALTALPLDDVESRGDANARLTAGVPNAAVRAYLLTNLVRKEGVWRWRINLRVIQLAMGEILGFPESEGPGFPGPALFVYGGRSDYISGAGLPRIRELFPLARLRAIPEAGHWVYSDRPDEFAAAVSGFLKD